MQQALKRIAANFTRKAVGAIATQSAVTIYSEGEDGLQGGSGVIIAPGLVLTAAHVLRDENITYTVIHKPSGAKSIVTDRLVFDDSDIAVLELADYIRAPHVTFAKQSPPIWQGVYCADVRPTGEAIEAPPERPVLKGYAMGREFDRQQLIGLAENSFKLTSKFRLAAYYGNSGGAIFNADTNEAISMITGIRIHNDKPAGAITYGVAAEILHDAVKDSLLHFAKERA